MTDTQLAETNGTLQVPPGANLLPKTLQDVTSMYVAPGDIQTTGVAMIEHIAKLCEPVFNGDWVTGEQEIPSTHALYILPIGKQVKDPKTGDNKRFTEHVVISLVPTLDTLLANEDGREYINDAMLSAFSAKIRNSLTRAEDLSSVKLPFTVEEFIKRADRGAADQGLAAFKTVGPVLVKALKSKGVEVSLAVLRQILASASFATALMPKVTQKVWVQVIKAGKAEAEKAKLPITIFDHWLSTRDQAATDVELDDIAFD
jgi:hypothetical protein